MGSTFFPPNLQHVLVAAEEPQVAVGAHDPHVARVKPTVRGQGTGRVLGLLVVALRDDVSFRTRSRPVRTTGWSNPVDGSTTRSSQPGSG